MTEEQMIDAWTGIEWFNSLSVEAREHWLTRAGGNASAADAWQAFKTAQTSGGSIGGATDPANTQGGGGGAGPLNDPPRGVIWYEFNQSYLPMLRDLVAKLERDGTATLVLDGLSSGKARSFPRLGVQD